SAALRPRRCPRRAPPGRAGSSWYGLLAFGLGDVISATADAALDQTWRTPLRERYVDHVEVLRHHGVGEDRTRLTCNLGSEVAIREVRQRQERHLGIAR